jgi:hypothetical protein
MLEFCAFHSRMKAKLICNFSSDCVPAVEEILKCESTMGGIHGCGPPTGNLETPIIKNPHVDRDCVLVQHLLPPL